MPSKKAAGALILSALLSGCASRSFDQLPRIPEASDAMIRTTVNGNRFAADDSVSAVRGMITLRDAVARTMERNPELAAAAWDVSVREAGTGLAGVRPNPEIEFEAEEFGGSGSRRGMESAELSIRLSQVVELGGKRTRRIKTASLEHALSRWDYELRRIDVLAGVTRDYIGLLAAQERLELARETERIAGEFHSKVNERVRSGKNTPLEETRARVSLSTERLRRAGAERTLAAARKRLAAWWGETNPEFTAASGNLDSLTVIPTIDRPERMVSENPDLRRWAVAMEYYTARVEQEKANRVPDIAVSGGAARFRGDDETALVLGLSVPLQIFSRNQWNTRIAERERSRAMEERRAAEIRASEELHARYEEFASAHERAETLIEEVIPAAGEALRVAEEGYRAGKFSYLDVLDAQRSFFESREESIEALAASHLAATELERLTGESLENIAQQKRQ